MCACDRDKTCVHVGCNRNLLRVPPKSFQKIALRGKEKVVLVVPIDEPFLSTWKIMWSWALLNGAMQALLQKDWKIEHK